MNSFDMRLHKDFELNMNYGPAKGRCNYGVAIFLLQVYPKTQRTKNFIFIFSLIILMQTSGCII